MLEPINNHVKPTPEELKAKEEAAIEEANKLEKNLPEEEESTEKITPEEEVEKIVEEIIPEEEEAEPSEEEKEALKQKLEAEKKKSSASARENQKIYAKNRVINKALTDADEIPEPTDEELTKEFTDWDVMSDVEKTLARETVISRNWRKVISQAKEQATKIEKWNDSVEVFVDDPKTLVDHPELEGKTEEFKTFATEEANNSVPFNILVSAFLHEDSKNAKSNKGRMFERAKGGSKEIDKTSDKLTYEQGRRLRETDYNKWKELLADGKIGNDL
jgi:hypothetical protein